jgi:heme-degrading monooxygenase HmoA
MSNQISQQSANRVYRVDKFDVPENAREEFLGKVQETHNLLRTLPGFLQDYLLENSTGEGIVKIVTIVEWQDASAIENAVQTVKAFRAQTQFDPQALLARLGIKADLGSYTPVNGN